MFIPYTQSMALRPLVFISAFSCLVACSANQPQSADTRSPAEPAGESPVEGTKKQGATVDIAPKAESLKASVSDGSGNHYTFSAVLKAGAYEQGRVVYSPVQPDESSSGTYSGGKPFDRPLPPARSSDIWNTLLALQGKSDIHVQARRMGTGSINISSDAGSESFLIQGGPDLDGLVRLLRDESN